MIETHDSSPIAYKSLADIRLHKEMVRNDIIKDDQKIKALWNDLFHKSAMLNASATPSKRLNGLMTTGAGILDGIILGWNSIVNSRNSFIPYSIPLLSTHFSAHIIIPVPSCSREIQAVGRNYFDLPSFYARTLTVGNI